MHYKRQEKAFRLHTEEAERKGAKIFNCGWGVNVEGNWISITSKTDKGILTSGIDFDGVGTEEHNWRIRK